MSSDQNERSDDETKTEGAVKGGDGDYLFDMGDVEDIQAGPDYATTEGGVVEGERIQVGLMHKPRGTGARPHKHPNEQFSYVLQGKLRVNIGEEEEQIAEPGDAIYIPPNTVHNTVATEEEDVVFFVAKDLSHGIAGEPVDTSTDEAHYESGFEPDEE